MARFIEYAAGTGRVDAQGGWIRGAKLLGWESKNGRRYDRTTAHRWAQKYVGTKVHVDHPSSRDLGEDRSINTWAGTVRSVRVESDGIYGDIQLRKESPHFKALIEAAMEFPESFGLSHVASGRSRIDPDGTEIIEEVETVHSVDLVCEPATAAGLFESTETEQELIDDDLASESAREQAVNYLRLLCMSKTEEIRVRALAADLIDAMGAERATDDTKDTSPLGDREVPGDDYSESHCRFGTARRESTPERRREFVQDLHRRLG